MGSGSWSSWSRNIPQSTRILLLIMAVAHSLCRFLPELSQYFYLTIDKPQYIWTFLTAGFYEGRPIWALFNGMSFLLGGKYFEHSWGSKEFLKFAFIVNTISVGLTFWVASLESYILNESIEEHQIICGFGALLAGFAISFKQAVPEHKLTLFKIFSIRVKYCALIGVLSTGVLFALKQIHFQFFLTLFGTITSWAYLRFFKKSDGTKGDRSDTFSFVSFFPEFIQPLVSPFANLIYNILSTLRILPDIASLGNPNYPDLEANRVNNLFENKKADAERRRALAMRTVDAIITNNEKRPALVESPKEMEKS